MSVDSIAVSPAVGGAVGTGGHGPGDVGALGGEVGQRSGCLQVTKRRRRLVPISVVHRRLGVGAAARSVDGSGRR